MDRDSGRLTGQWRVVAAGAFLFAVAGCAVTPQPLTRDEIANRVSEDRARMHAGQEPVQGAMSFADVAARVLKYNLEYRLRMLEGALSESQLAVGKWDMFPSVLANAGYVHRNNELAYLNGAGVPSTTTLERSRRLAGLEFSWNVVDFGVSYYRAKILADQVLIAEERKRKVVQNLLQETRQAYWRALGAQRLGNRIDGLMKSSNIALARARMIEQQGLLPKTQALAYQRALLDATTQMQLRRQDLEVAKLELAALMNLRPATPYTLADEPEPSLPPIPANIDKLEEMALNQRPELREEDYRRRISLHDTRRAIASTLPGITFDAGWQYDSNRFLVNSTWVETGLRVSANLFKLASIPAIRRSGEAQSAVDDVRRLAQAMAVITQVRVASLRYNLAKEELSQAAESARVDLRLANYTKAAASSRVDSELELIRTEARSLLSQYQRHIAFANAQAAWGRLYNSLGLDIMPPADDADLSTLARSIRDSLNAWHRVTFDRPVSLHGPLPKLALRIEGIEDQVLARGVRDGVISALRRNRLQIAEDAKSDWTLVVRTTLEAATGEGARTRWQMELIGPGGAVRERASYSSVLARVDSSDALRALTDSALDAYAVAVSDRLDDAATATRTAASR